VPDILTIYAAGMGNASPTEHASVRPVGRLPTALLLSVLLTTARTATTEDLAIVPLCPSNVYVKRDSAGTPVR